MVANDGNPLIFVQEVASNENIRTEETGNTVNNRPATSAHQDLDGQGVISDGNGTTRYGVSREARSGNGRNVLLSQWGESADSGNVLVENGGIEDVHKGIFGGESNNDNEVRQSVLVIQIKRLTRIYVWVSSFCFSLSI